jgi:hypothetical protein
MLVVHDDRDTKIMVPLHEKIHGLMPEAMAKIGSLFLDEDIMMESPPVVLKESELEVILHNLATVKIRGGCKHPDPGQLYDSITDTRTSQVHMRHV